MNLAKVFSGFDLVVDGLLSSLVGPSIKRKTLNVDNRMIKWLIPD